MMAPGLAAIQAASSDPARAGYALVLFIGLTAAGIAIVAGLAALYFVRRGRAIREAKREPTRTDPDPWVEAGRRMSVDQEDLE